MAGISEQSLYDREYVEVFSKVLKIVSEIPVTITTLSRSIQMLTTCVKKNFRPVIFYVETKGEAVK